MSSLIPGFSIVVLIRISLARNHLPSGIAKPYLPFVLTTQTSQNSAWLAVYPSIRSRSCWLHKLCSKKSVTTLSSNSMPDDQKCGAMALSPYFLCLNERNSSYHRVIITEWFHWDDSMWRGLCLWKCLWCSERRPCPPRWCKWSQRLLQRTL